MSMAGVPTFEEYKARLIEKLLKYELKLESRKKVAEYVESEIQYVRDMYKHRVEAVKSGEVLPKYFFDDGAAHGLGMMFEG